MMDITVDSEVPEQKRLILRQDTGHTSTKNRAAGVLALGVLMTVSGKGQRILCLTLAAAVRAERSRRQLIRKTQDKASAVCLLGLFHVWGVGGCEADDEHVSSSSRVCSILLHSPYSRFSWYITYARSVAQSRPTLCDPLDCSLRTKNCFTKSSLHDFPGGPVIKNLPANAGDTGLTPDPRSHVLWGNSAHGTTLSAFHN